MNPSAHAEVGYRVLIVDDSPEDRYAFRRQLQKCATHAYTVSEAESGSAGLAQSRLAPPDCVLLDYHLPDLNGVEFLQRLRAEGRGPAPAVVMLTGQGNESLAVAAIKAGAEDYLVKGISSTRLCHAIPHAIESVGMRRQLAARAAEIEQIARERAQLIDALEERARTMAEADRRKDEFLATLAHELRNPLAPIRSAMHALKWLRPDDSQVGEVSAVVERQVRHLAQLVDDLTDVARITGGKVHLRHEHVLLSEIIRGALELCAPLLRAHYQEVRIHQPGAPVTLRADALRLTQILVNVLGNAVKYGDRPAPVDLRAEVTGQDVVFTITDHGIGIEPHMLAHIFEIFSQVRTAGKRGPEGLGIGLALARQFCQLHGGTITARSDGPGHGSTFTVRLPVVVAAAPADPDAVAPTADPGPGANTGPQRVLLVDDNVDAANMLQMLFEVDGYEVAAVYNGPAAIAHARTLQPDFIVMDLSMPGMDGYAAMRAMRHELGLTHSIAIALTGWNHPGVTEAVREAGFDHHLVKPVEYAKLKALINARCSTPSPG